MLVTVGVVSFGLAETPIQGRPSSTIVGLAAIATPLQGCTRSMNTLSW